MGYLLEPVGLSETDNRVFLAVLESPRATSGELTEQLGIASSAVRLALAHLIAAGLVTKLLGRPQRYVSAPPDVAVEALVARRHEELSLLRVQARELTTRMERPSGTGAAELLEVLDSNEAIQQHLAQTQLGARQEVLIVDSPPYLLGQPVQNIEELQALRRGVSYRCVYQASALDLPGHFDQLQSYVAAGEQARTLPVTAMKMQIVDRQVAIVPLSLDPAETGVRLLVRASPLLDALVRCFESMWDQAYPVLMPDQETSPDDGEGLKGGIKAEPGLSDKDRQLLSLMAAGKMDQATARILGVTQRTVSRRVAELMDQLGAETRFQAGLQAARRGWL